MAEPTLRFLDWQYLHTYLVWIYEGPPQQTRGLAFHPDFTAWLIERGSVTLQVNGKKYQARAGEWVLLPPGYDERCFSSRARILSIVFSAQWLTGVPLFELDCPFIFKPRETSGWRACVQPMLRIVKSRFPRAYEHLRMQAVEYGTYISLQRHLQSWLLRVWPQLEARGAIVHLLQPNHGRAIAIKKRLDAQPLREPFRLHKLSRQSGLSPSQVNRIFYTQFGTTPKRYLEQRRLIEAKSALQTSDHSIKEISWSLGFTYNSLFSTWFLKKTQSTPRRFREMARATAVHGKNQSQSGSSFHSKR